MKDRSALISGLTFFEREARPSGGLDIFNERPGISILFFFYALLDRDGHSIAFSSGHFRSRETGGGKELNNPKNRNLHRTLIVNALRERLVSPHDACIARRQKSVSHVLAGTSRN